MDTNGVSTSVDAADRVSAADSGTDVRTFLIVDVRGYTHFTQTLGDEEAARLAASFAALTRKAVTAMGGEVIELRGDEALCVFRSVRQALRTAVELQVRFRERIEGQPAFPLGIGIGLDAGEAVPVEGGYRGGALNLAARLCSLAAPGQILASETVASLARRLEGIRFVERRGTRMKGLEKRVRVIEVVPEVELPPVPEAPRPSPRARRRRVLIALGGVVLALAAAVAGMLLARGNDARPFAVAANSVAVIDPATNAVVGATKVGDSPGPIAASRDSLWVVNLNDRTLMKIDSVDRSVTASVGLPALTGRLYQGFQLAVGPRDVWVYACGSKLVRIDSRNAQIVQELDVGRSIGYFGASSCAVAVEADSVWVPVDKPWQLLRVAAPTTAPAFIAKRIPLPAWFRSSIALGAGSVWVADHERGAVRRIDPTTGVVTKTIPLDDGPRAMAFGYGAVWVVNEREDSVSRIRPRTNSIVYAIPVGEHPTAIAVGAGALWVANSGNGTVSRIDPETNTVTNTIEVGHRPLGIAVGDSLVWVTVRA